jgi:hypothetical protein
MAAVTALLTKICGSSTLWVSILLPVLKVLLEMLRQEHKNLLIKKRGKLLKEKKCIRTLLIKQGQERDMVLVVLAHQDLKGPWHTDLI